MGQAMNTDKTQLIPSSSVYIGAQSVANAVVPVARVASPVSFRLATLADVPKLDALQKQFNKALGYFKTEWFEGYIGMGAVLVAEVGGGGSEVGGSNNSPPTTDNQRPTLVGYCISRDRYLKRDELGIIFQ